MSAAEEDPPNVPPPVGVERVASPTGARPSGPSYGNMGPEHWSRARLGENAEAMEYYRSRSHAPGVAEGGAERNFYCMECDGVIPFDQADPTCPHCGASLAGQSKRYFNWVEINEPPASDARALLPFLFGGIAVLTMIGLGLWWWLGRSAA